MMTEKDLIGRTIKDIVVTGFGIEILFTDGITFVYNASDGGYSSWGINGELKLLQEKDCEETELQWLR